MPSIPRPEHPKPQFQRSDWLNLNGAWQFRFDFGASGFERGWSNGTETFDREILVPFCPESRLSGIGYTDFIPCVWYQRTFTIPEAWAGSRVFLHFGGVDFECRAWVNGSEVGRHVGGSSSFAFEISQALRPGPNTLTVAALDDLRSALQPSGKQSPQYHSHGCVYTRTTGIWQTVWLEARPAGFIDSVQVIPDLDGGGFVFLPRFSAGTQSGLRWRVRVRGDGIGESTAEAPAVNGIPLRVEAPGARPWSPGDPYLYDVEYELLEADAVMDHVRSYAGLRKIHIEGYRIFLNNRPIFLRFVLDQGFYPDGLWTAPSDAELEGDIRRAMSVGFNGARLHQKVFEERFHYWADRLGYLTWGEYCDWSIDRAFTREGFVHNMLAEWSEVVLRDRNHPSIIAWTPTNETRDSAGANLARHRRITRELVRLTHALDPTRPVNDASGYVHVETELYTDHNYEQNPEIFRQHYEKLTPEAREGFHGHFADLSTPYAGQPFLVDEYGGARWRPGTPTGPEQSGGWGYGKTPASIEEVYHRIEGLTAVLTGHPYISGFCYTQLTDVEQEQNGIYTYDRKLKFDAERLRAIFGAPAAIEDQEVG